MIRDSSTAGAFFGIFSIAAILFIYFAVNGSYMPLILVAAVIIGLVGLYEPYMLVVGIFLTVSIDAIGNLGVSLAGIPLTASKLAVAGSTTIWIARAVLSRQPFLRWTPLTLPLIAVLGTMLISIMASGRYGPAQAYFASIIMLGFMVHLIYSLLPPERTPQLMRFLQIGTLCLVAYGVFSNPEATSGRSQGTTLNPNVWATTLLVLCPLILGTLSEDKSKVGQFVMVGILILLPVSVVQSLSRGGLIALIAASPGIIWLVRKHWALSLVCAAIAMVLVFYYVDLNQAWDRFSALRENTDETTDGSIAYRADALRTGIEAFLGNWLIGVGASMFPWYYAQASMTGHLGAAHNTYVTIAAEQGILGIISHAFLILTMISVPLQMFFRAKIDRHRAWAVGAITSCFATLVNAMSGDYLTLSIIWFCASLVLVLDRALYLESPPVELPSLLATRAPVPAK